MARRRTIKERPTEEWFAVLGGIKNVDLTPELVTIFQKRENFMLAFISVAPADHWEHMSPYVAEAVKVLEASGLDYELGSMGTSIEGEPAEVFKVMEEMHMAIRMHSKRVSTSIKIDDQVDRPLGRLKAKVASVKEKL